jgi:hypothetical protein
MGRATVLVISSACEDDVAAIGESDDSTAHAGVDAEGDHVCSTSSMRRPIQRMTLTAMLLPSAR